MSHFLGGAMPRHVLSRFTLLETKDWNMFIVFLVERLPVWCYVCFDECDDYDYSTVSKRTSRIFE